MVVVDRIYKIRQDLHVNHEKSCKSCLQLMQIRGAGWLDDAVADCVVH